MCKLNYKVTTGHTNSKNKWHLVKMLQFSVLCFLNIWTYISIKNIAKKRIIYFRYSTKRGLIGSTWFAFDGHNDDHSFSPLVEKTANSPSSWRTAKLPGLPSVSVFQTRWNESCLTTIWLLLPKNSIVVSFTNILRAAFWINFLTTKNYKHKLWACKWKLCKTKKLLVKCKWN